MNECNYTRSCYYCSKSNAHHRSLCPKKFGALKNESAHLVEELTESDVKDITETENALISTGEIVLMQTAQVTMKIQLIENRKVVEFYSIQEVRERI